MAQHMFSFSLAALEKVEIVYKKLSWDSLQFMYVG